MSSKMDRHVPLFFGNPITMMISNEIDRHGTDMLSNSLVDLLNDIVGPRYLVRLEPEVRLLGSLLYYFSIFTNKYKLTPAQQLCGLKMIEVETKPITYEAYFNQLYLYIMNYFKDKNQKSPINFVYLKDITTANQLLLVLLWSLGPYIHSRRAEISFLLEESLSILLGNDESSNAVNTDSIENEDAWDFITKKLLKYVHAFGKTCIAWSSTPTGRFENLCTIIYELNYMMFLFNAEYIEPAFRICRIRMINIDNNRTGRYSKLKAFAWLLSFRLALLCYASVKIFITELTTDSNVDNNNDANNNTIVSRDANNNINDTNTTANNNVVVEAASGKKCSLCIDALKNPSCTPCGHIYCWECIMRCCSQQHIGTTSMGTLMNTDSSNNSKVKCPKCRREFLPQSIRPLYNY